MPHGVTLIATIAAAFGLAMVFGFIAVRFGLPVLLGYGGLDSLAVAARTLYGPAHRRTREVADRRAVE